MSNATVPVINNLTTTLNSATLTTTMTTITTTIGTITTTIIAATSSLLSVTSTISTNSSTIYENCLRTYSTSTCRLGEFVRVIAYLFLAVSFIPQIIYLFHHGSKYIAGISYLWLIIRVLGLTSLMVAHAFNWSSIFELIAIISTIVVFIQIFIHADNLHRQQKIILIGGSLLTWIIGGGIILLLRKHDNFLILTGYLLLSVHMLPQILLNSLLRTAKALSKFSILFLAMSDTLLFASFYTVNERYPYLVTTYYAFSFFLFMYLQSIVYSDENVHLISRSAHTVLTPGFDVFTGPDSNGSRSLGQDPQMFSIDDLEPADGTDVVYQPVTSNKTSQPIAEQTPMKRAVWYATLASIIGIEIVLTIMLVVRAWSLWIILVPVSIPALLGVFFLLRTKLSVLQTEKLRKIL
ncbi:unnamed protein product [Rotaria magnacalcarata]|uniref:Transmembrane protein n=1 Tax=Rotaria magnacalcarata TaxID=392030 RepID=A0A815SI81_9BILA|nr:unnamed protein product [Rotaria magnacalcarata]CAF1492764.1 unnamed protein product [Rotaria magnacalcarata]CAF1928013.1 unnamed protein product [Rotaria magnacalcarata]CAF2193631.1 unnamed protein product [Rotaria magnacalcarata]CAF2206260.1 unnamed protein product [Rotaria magnacalcarata]